MISPAQQTVAAQVAETIRDQLALPGVLVILMDQVPGGFHSQFALAAHSALPRDVVARVLSDVKRRWDQPDDRSMRLILPNGHSAP